MEGEASQMTHSTCDTERQMMRAAKKGGWLVRLLGGSYRWRDVEAEKSLFFVESSWSCTTSKEELSEVWERTR